MIPMVDLKRQYHIMKTDIDAAIAETLEETQFILGSNVRLLEEEVGTYHGGGFAVGVANGTDALLLALRACDITAGDEVITTPFTFIATAEVITQLGATPVFVDISPETFNIDPAKIEERINKKTKAIIPVHLFGQPADMESIMTIARRHGLRVIEDCAQAFGAEFRGRKVATFGDCGAFSFFPSKNLACYGDGGMVIAADAALADRVRVLRNHGSRVRYYHELIGYNSRLDEIQAAILRIKLRKIDEMNENRRRNADCYRHFISRSDVRLPREAPGTKHVYHQFTLLTPHRDNLASALKAQGIASAVYYPVPLHRQQVFKDLEQDVSDFPVSEAFSKEVLSLPMFPELTEEEIRRIATAINGAP
ncbi:MAG: DegT/DnrJ/EryC1/StrS family aminotransferase [Deltaproteobacteria bacterium]|nr:DegT/DnrJ/EryC1/StrS family aminotransferase [Deltaproteobacteria bacterium]